jgi:phenylalanyl-tRNA synthetase beta subunit
MTILREEAIYKLANHSSYRHNDTEILDWSNGDPPTEEEIETTRLEMQAEYDAQEYARKREVEYPSIQECVHAILDDTLDALQAKRASVKLKYPKGG